jgi:NADH pyrophosphatase NudC (nudix superfamily)
VGGVAVALERLIYLLLTSENVRRLKNQILAMLRAGEIDEARWFSRDELRALLRDADEGRATPSGITLPGPVSIARRMVEAFVQA